MDKNGSSRLKDFAIKKVRTTMIGAIAELEKNLDLKDEEIKKVFEEIRQNILNLGNSQIRSLEKEFTKYDVFQKVFKLIFKGAPGESLIREQGKDESKNKY